ncbi:MAG TPA: ATPase, T2SS/T4P/T4SS family, partial [Oceanipulchritudo sp.]|nr:ATPase, T2SS/T4P/T4SS family [Oceanipulchritudo sp.]
MEEEVQLFAEKVIGAGLIDAAKARQLWGNCEDKSDIIAFGEALLQDLPEDFEQVQNLVNEAAVEFSQGGRPTSNPFATKTPVSVSVATSSQPSAVAPAPPASAPVSEPTSRGPGGRGSRPAESVVSAAGITPGRPDFATLDPGNQPQIASALIAMLLSLGEADFSDLHLSGGSRPFGRRFGKLEYLAEQPINEQLAEAFGMALLSPAQQAYFKQQQDYEFAIALDSGHRYRTNLMQHRDGLKITFRLVPNHILTLEELGFGPHIETIKNLLAYHNGLILVTGPVGCGKTATLAAMVDELNKNRTDHIICVEEPIEIVHRSNQCSVTQRGVGPHTKSFKSALKGALRQDPDIIVIGDMRDLETIEMAISASETGHLVIGTMHTSDA